MYIVEVAYGMESYQVERKKFSEYLYAMNYFRQCKAKKPVSIKVFNVIESYSIFDEE